MKDRQVSLIGAMYILNSSLVSTSAQTVFYAKQHGWVSYLVPVPFLLFALWLLSKVTKRYPDKDLLQILVEEFPFLGRCFVFVFLLFYFYIYARDIRMFVDFSNVSLLPATPLVIISSLVVITTVWIARGGIEAIARITDIYAPLLIVTLLVLPLLVAKDMDRNALRPFLAMDVPGVMIGGWYAFSYVGEILAIFFIFSGKMYHLKHVYIGLGMGVGLTLLLTVLNMLVLGTELTPKFLYPNYELVRQINVTDFLDRFELVLVGIWAPTMLTKISYSLYVIAHALQRFVPSIDWKLSISPLALLGFVCSFWLFQNALQLFTFTKQWTVFAVLCEFMLPIIIYLLFRWKKPTSMKMD